MSVELTHQRFWREVRAMSMIDPQRKRLLDESERWLEDLAQALGFPGHNKDGFEVFTTRWDDDGSVHVHAYVPNDAGARYIVGQGADRRVAVEWFECPVPPPAGLRELAKQDSLPLFERVSSDEIRKLMLRVADGSAKVTQPDGAISWDEMYAGDVEFLVDGWTVVVFNDCDEWDYVDHVVAPDGREGEFDDWPDDARNFGLKGDVYERMKAAFTGKSVS